MVALAVQAADPVVSAGLVVDPEFLAVPADRAALAAATRLPMNSG